ncbi:MAG: undecaprenyl-diphosphate phosphatase [Collinsella sp.]
MDIIELLKSAFMGLVEGITEWLPVSSTGHMILVDEFVKMNVSETFWNMFLVVIQLGAILAVCVLFFYDLNPFSPSKGKEGRRDTWVLWGKIVLGCIPAAAIGLPLNDWMEEHFYNAPVVALALIVYGVLFIVIENWRANKRDQAALAGSFGSRAVVAGGRPAGAHFAAPAATAAADDDDNLDFGSITTLEDLSWKTALGIGCFQVLSLVPGTSRSGSTIIGGLLLGCTRSVASKFTFFRPFLSCLARARSSWSSTLLRAAPSAPTRSPSLGVGCVVAFVVSLIAIKWLMGFVRRHDFSASASTASSWASWCSRTSSSWSRCSASNKSTLRGGQGDNLSFKGVA